MTRDRLPNRRGTETFEFSHLGVRYLVSFSRYPLGHQRAGQIAEIFIDMGKRDAVPLAVLSRDAALVASLALQHGATVEEIVAALERDETGPLGPLGAALLRAENTNA